MNLLYGIDTKACGRLKPDSQRKFLYYGTIHSEFVEWLELNGLEPTAETLSEFMECYDYENHNGASALIAGILDEKYGLKPHISDDGRFVGILAALPWDFDEKERQLTQETFDGMLYAIMDSLFENPLVTGYYFIDESSS